MRVIRLGDVDLTHALGEGEGYSSVADWRAGHEQFWHSADMRSALDDPEFTVNDDTLVVAQTFRLLERCLSGLPHSAAAYRASPHEVLPGESEDLLTGREAVPA